jgi:nucleoside-triphosphatase
MAPLTRRHVLLTGAPGCGKTTLLGEAAEALRDSGREVYGFWTPEIREGGRRLGFAAELMGGEREVLASRDLAGPPRVGGYGVNLAAMDGLVVPEIDRGVAAAGARAAVIIVMDEIGKMELFARGFREVVARALDSQARVLGTIMARPHPFADALKMREDVGIVTVTRDNRERLCTSIIEALLVP